MSFKKICFVVLSFVLILSCAGCAFSAAALPLNVVTGDKLIVKMHSDDTYYKLEFDDEKNLLKMFENSNQENKYICALHSEETLNDYIGIVLTALETNTYDMTIVDNGTINGVKYTLVSFDNGDGKTYEIIGWIQGSNTGLVLDGYISKDETIKAFSALTFEIKSTEQEDEKYYYKNINNLEKLM